MNKDNFWFDWTFNDEIKAWIEANAESVVCEQGSLACQDMSYAWAQAIHTRFSDAEIEIVGGMFVTEDEWGDLDQEGHGWLLVSGAIFDPTAAQFDVFPNIDESNYEADDYEMFP